MGQLAVNSLAAYCAWGILSSLIPVVHAGSSTWRMPAWMRALAIAAIAYGLYSVPARYVHALACAALVLFAMMIAIRLGAALPEPYSITMPRRRKPAAPQQQMRGYSPSTGQPGRRVPRLD